MNENYFSEADTDSFKETICSIIPMSSFDFELLLPLIHKKAVKKQDYILREGEVCKSIFFLINGFVRMYYIDFNGNEINYRFTDKSNFFVDFQSVLTQKPSRYYWQAMQDSELFILPYKDVQQIYHTSPAWNNFGRLMAEHVYLQLNERVDMLLFMKPEERYLYLRNKQPHLFNQVSQSHLSSYMGIKPESLSRLRKRLSEK